MKKILFLISILYIYPSFAYTPITTDARIKTFIYSPTEIFKLKFHHNYQSYIEFPKNEKFKIISLGDPYAWNVKQVGSRLFIKPQQAGMSTNMTIITNQRPYHFEIISSDKSIDVTDVNLVYVARFFYPDKAYDFMQTVKIKKPLTDYDSRPVNNNQAAAPQQQANVAPAAPQPDTNISNNPAAENMPNSNNNMLQGNNVAYNYAYSMVGPDSAITPIKIYDNGINTYFEFATNILPDIFYVNKDGSETAAQYSVKDNIVTVQNTAWQFSLRNNKDIICVFNESKVSY